MVGVGNIVSVGGSGGGGGGGSGSGIRELNGQIGPVVTLVGTSGIVIAPVAPNVINIGFTGDVSQSGVVGVNGINVEQVDGEFVIDGAALSGVGGGGNECFAQSFGPVTSGFFQHNLNTRNLLVQVLNNDSPPQLVLPDAIIYDTLDAFSVLFNSPRVGTVVAVSCGGTAIGGSVSNRVEIDLEFKSAFNSDTYSEITRVSGQLSQIDIWETNLKTNKLFTKILTRVSGQISQVFITDEQSLSTLVTDIARVSGQISTITKNYTA